ncbi:MAG TPA: response regulator transcription factor [Geobacteraceae bacterium]|nr:response regulator transcription factor [Geobacteraceae bacterium]
MGIRVQLVDDHKIMREGLKALLARTPDIEVVAEADNGQTAIQKAAEFTPDVIVMDLSMPEMNGIEATRGIIAENPGIRVLALSMLLDRNNIIETLKAGAKGYMSKDCVFDELVEAIRSIAAGNSYLGAKITELVIEDYSHNKADDRSDRYDTLSRREREVLLHIADGKNTKDIAFTLGVSIKTIEIQRLSVMKKLDLHSIAELTKYAVRKGLTDV